MTKIRKSAVAGSFYPSNVKALNKIIDGMLKNAENMGFVEIRGLISPHAGYIYSGSTAAKAYKQIEGMSYKTVIIIGPSHNVYFNGISVGSFDAFMTPLGNVKVDKDFINEMKKFTSDKIDSDMPQIQEHSIEVQIPFLQKTLNSDFKIVPIIMGNQSQKNIYDLAMLLYEIGTDKDLLIVSSSDLYHGYNYDECDKEGNEFVKQILTFDTDTISKYVEDKEFTHMPIACGTGPIISNLIACKMWDYKRIKLMDFTNSVDVIKQNPGGYVVGYSSFVIYRK